MTLSVDAVDKIAIAFIAGGRAHRMGGIIKPLIEIGGMTILARQLKTLSAYTPKFINTNSDHSRFSDFALPLISDDIEGFAGPLAGIVASLDYTAAHHPEKQYVLSIATDAPFIPSDLPIKLYRALSNNYDIAQARSYSRRHPVFALWSISLRHDLREMLTRHDLRKIDDFTARHRTAIVDFSGTPDPFLNINTPADIDKANILCDTDRAEQLNRCSDED